MSLSNTTALVKDYLQTIKALMPLQAKAETLKPQLRDLGPGTYDVPKLGVVTVSKASTSKLKGTEFKLNLEAFMKLSEKERSSLQAKGVIKLENVYSREVSAKVEAKVI